ncbi:MAG: ubiquinone/menaquinone biosynthesis methyltransferase [Phycisphaerales bacterium]|nr:ubiquinone/menaquinone biosynthesis methyltransferase [Phycisphaerales bacterium]
MTNGSSGDPVTLPAAPTTGERGSQDSASGIRSPVGYPRGSGQNDRSAGDVPPNESSGGGVLWEEATLRAPHAQADKAARVRRMFEAIAPTYERVNTLFSAGRDRAWRRAAVAAANVGPEDTVLDVACGTGDLSRAFFEGQVKPQQVVGGDFARGMLTLAAARSDGRIGWVQGDALHLPFPRGCFTVVSCAFGVRNFQDAEAGLREMHRVLRPGGRAVVLEFTLPRGRLMRMLYLAYCRVLMPWGATLVSRDRTGAYRYLPRSIEAFVDDRDPGERLKRAGFASVWARPMTMGIVTIYHAVKSNDGE